METVETVDSEADEPVLKRPASAKAGKDRAELPPTPKAVAKAKAKSGAKAKPKAKVQAAKASAAKFCKPNYYKTSNRWGIKRAGKEMVSAPWLHPGIPCSCLL